MIHFAFQNVLNFDKLSKAFDLEPRPFIFFKD